MMFRPKFFKARTLGEFAQSGKNIAGYQRRIYNREKAGLINMIIIDGVSQSGKTTFGREICRANDKNYVTIFSVTELLNFIKSCKETSEYGKYKWILYDEPELDVDRANWFDERNKVLAFILSSYGFLHLNIVMCLPNIRRLSDTILTNISMRISIKTDYDELKNTISRRALIKKAVYSEYKNKFIWITVEFHRIPAIEKDTEYEARKRSNFYDRLPVWEKMVEERTNEFTISGGILI
jgi:hypothetical protein